MRNVLDRYEEEVTEIVVGDSTGADESARLWAMDHGVNMHVFHSDPKHGGRLELNVEALAERPSLCLAFPVEGSKGTMAVVSAAKRMGIPVTIIPEFDNERPRKTVKGAIVAVPADIQILNMTMKHLIGRFHQGIIVAGDYDHPPQPQPEQVMKPAVGHAGGPKPVRFADDPEVLQGLAGVTLGAYARIADKASVAVGGSKQAGRRYNAVIKALTETLTGKTGEKNLESQAETIGRTLAGVDALAPCSCRTGVVVASTILETYGRAVSSRTAGFTGAVKALSGGEPEFMLGMIE